MGNLAVVVDEVPLVKSLVDEPADFIGNAPIERYRLAAKFQRSQQQAVAGLQFVASPLQPGLDAVAIHRELVQAALDLGLRHGIVGGEIEQPLLLDVELGKLLAQGVVQELHVGLLLVHGLNQQLTECLEEVVVESQGQIVPFDSAFDLRHRQVGQVADAVLPTSADEVGVVVTVAAPDFGIDEAAGPAFLMAAFAEQHALEVVEVDSVALAAGAACCEHLLRSVKQGLADNRLVPPRQQFAFVGEHAQVVRVLQHSVQLAIGDRLLAPLGTRSRGQAVISHRVGETF